MKSAVAISRAATKAEALFRRLESSHSLTTVVIMCILTALLSREAYSRYEPVPRELDLASVTIAASMLQTYRQAEVRIGKPSTASGRSAGAPGYPLVLFALALADPAVEKAIACTSRMQPCGPDASFRSLLIVQFALAMIVVIAVFALAFRLSTSWEVAALTLILTFFSSKFGDFAAVGFSFIWLLAFTYILILLTVEAHLRRSLLSAFGAGLAGGSLALFLPQAIVAVLVAIFLPVCLCIYRNQKTLPAAANAVAAAAGLAVTGTLVSVALSLGYDPGAAVRSISLGISARVAFHAMDFQTWVVSLIMPLPIVGELAENILPGSVTLPVRPSLGPGTFALRGYQEIYPQTLARPGTAVDQLVWLIDTHVWRQATHYLVATPTFFLRGVWGGTEFVGLIGVFHIKGMLALQRLNGHLDRLLLALVPIGTLFVANTLLTANYVWTNTTLAFVYAYAIAYVIDAYRRPSG